MEQGLLNKYEKAGGILDHKKETEQSNGSCGLAELNTKKLYRLHGKLVGMIVVALLHIISMPYYIVYGLISLLL